MISGRDEFRPLDAATLDRVRAAQVKMTAGRRIDRARNVTRQDGTFAACARPSGTGIAESSACV